MNAAAGMALRLTPEKLQSQPVFLCIDGTMVPKSGKKFEGVPNLFDHAAHNGSNYLDGHCLVSVMLCVPVWDKGRTHYLSVPLGYRMWQKEEPKPELAASMARRAMPESKDKKNVIILCGSRYVKKGLVSIVDEYDNLDLIGNAGPGSVICDLPPQPAGKRGRPAVHGRRLSIQDGFGLSDGKIGGLLYACTPRAHEYFWQTESPCICDIAREGFRRRVPVLQHGLPRAAADILCTAGEGPAEPGREQPHAVHPHAPL